MKKYLFLIPVIIVIGVLACQSTAKEPNDLEGKKAFLKEKKAALAILKEEIKTLEDEILVLDPPKDKPAVLVNTHNVQLSKFQRFVELQGVVSTDNLILQGLHINFCN